MKYFIVILSFSFLFTTGLQAFELETRLPASVWEVEMSFLYTPSYEQAFNGYGEEAPLQELILWDRDWRDSVEGKLQREEQVLEIRIAYGFSEIWLMEATIPLLQKKQNSTLKIASATVVQQKVLDNLASENLSGLGDIKLKFAKDMSTNTSWHNRGGFIFRLPTGSSGTARGISANAIGDGHGSIGAFLHFNWYPLAHGIRNGFRLEAANELLGKRETLEGEKGYYSAGHSADIFYNWSIERDNIFAGTELHYFQQSESKLPTGKSNAAFLKEINLEFGYGNLSELEHTPLATPWQIRLGYTRPLAGQNTPVAHRWELSSTFYF
ncbi:MAG: hypothetical protein H8E38_11225 [SAR324 cluster bacterium]|nr:hypothetical protein [SAR324 cluster bacterium]MBL7034397.1 hypothetical protein [SAR324 cluster bacterium]